MLPDRRRAFVVTHRWLPHPRRSGGTSPLSIQPWSPHRQDGLRRRFPIR